MTQEDLGKTADAYIISLQPEDKKEKLEALVSRVEELQMQYGAEKFSVYRKFEYIPAVAVIIKEEGILEMLVKDGYLVERQAEMKTQSLNMEDA